MKVYIGICEGLGGKWWITGVFNTLKEAQYGVRFDGAPTLIVELWDRNRLLGSWSKTNDSWVKKPMGASPGEHSEPASEPISADVSHTAGEDERIYVDKRLHLNGKETKIVVTSRRAIIGEKTYALQNITSIEVGDDAEEIAEKNKRIEKDNKPWDYRDFMSRAPWSLTTLVAWFWAIFLILREDTTRDAFTALFDWVGALFLFFVGISGFSKTKKPLLLTTYSIRVSAAGTVDNILYSTDHELVTEIVEELNTSIINLQMQGHPWNGNPGVEAFAPRSGDLLP